MTVSSVLAGYRSARLRAFRWRAGLGITGKLLLSLAAAGFTGISAQVGIRLPFTPVPITGQVFAVLVAGALLGGNCGALSQIIYVAAGAAGVPWFAGATAGVLGVSGGYLLGFVPAAWLVGRFTDGHRAARGIFGQACLMMAAVAVIYLFGAVQFAIVMKTGAAATLAAAVLPFVGIDAVKALGAAALTAALLPKNASAGRE